MADDEDVLTSSTDPDDNDGEPQREELAFERVLRKIMDEDRKDQRLWSDRKFSELKHCVHDLDVKVATVDTKVGGLADRLGNVEDRCKSMEGSMGTIVTHYHETSAIVSAVESRTATNAKRLSDEHKSLSEVAREQRQMRLNCVAHNGNIRALSEGTRSAKDALGEHAKKMEQLSEKLGKLTNSSGQFQVKVQTTWRALAIAAGSLVVMLGALWALLKHFQLIGLVALILATGGCTSSSLRTKTVLNVESKHRVMDTAQTCGSAQELIPLVEKAWPVILDEMVKAGIVKDPSKLEADLKGTFWRGSVRACLLEQPDVCGPCKAGAVGNDLCARKRGCASSFARFIWISRWWGPVCRGDWPTEPHCVLPGAAPRSLDYRSDLVAEMGNFIWQASKGKENYHGMDVVLKAIAAAVGRLGW